MKLQAVTVSEIIEEKISDAEVGGGADINAICSRPEVADGVISGNNVDTFLDHHAGNL